MRHISFEWDRRKDASNQKKHRVSFDEAKSVFYDERARIIPDPEHSMDDDRFILIGMSAKLRLLLVCHCYRKGIDTIRIISARKATRAEREQYEERKYERKL